MSKKDFSRRSFIKGAAGAGLGLSGLALAGCAAQPQTIIQTIEVEKAVEKEVIRTVEIEKEKLVEKKVIELVEVEKEVVKTVLVDAGAPKMGGKLVAATRGDITIVDPHRWLSFITMQQLNNVVEGLVAMNINMEPVPAVASSWDVSPDGKTYTFNLRQGVKLHNGREITAEDVKFSVQRMKDSPSYFGPFFQIINSIDVVDNYTVRLNLEKPYYFLLQKLGGRICAIIPPEVLDSEGNMRETVSCGPFVFKEHVDETRIVVDKFQDYWNQPKPYLDTVEMRPIVESSSKIIALQTGQVDWIDAVPFSEIDRLKQDPNLNVQEVPSAFCYCAILNCKPGWIYEDVRVRQAHSWALDRNAMVKGALFGHGTPATTPIPGAAPWDFGVSYYPFQDIDKAKALMAEAGYPNGYDQELEIMSYGIYHEMVASGTMMQEMWKEIGMNYRHNPAEIGQIIQVLIDEQSHDIYLTGIPEEVDPDYKLYAYYHSESSGNHSNYVNKKLDAYMEKGSFAKNEDVMKENWSKAIDIIMDEVPWIWTFYSNHTVASHPKVKGFEMYVDSQAYFDRVFLDE